MEKTICTRLDQLTYDTHCGMLLSYNCTCAVKLAARNEIHLSVELIFLLVSDSYRDKTLKRDVEASFFKMRCSDLDRNTCCLFAM